MNAQVKTDSIICGDCLEVMPQIPDKSVDMVLADLPYGVTACKWDTPLPLDDLWSEWLRICKGAIVLTGRQPFTSKLVLSQPNLFKDEWIWDKRNSTNFLNANRHPLSRHENICVFSENGYVYNPQPRQLNKTTKRINKKKYSTGNRGANTYPGLGKEYTRRSDEHGFPITILKFPKEVNTQFIHRLFHPTQKPVALFEYLIRTYTNEGDTVLDPTAGSGTTAVACHKSNRHYICIEKEPEYCAIAEKRLMEML
jgi:site-specific DNA-methyltransferase (adenine-specific)